MRRLLHHRAGRRLAGGITPLRNCRRPQGAHHVVRLFGGTWSEAALDEFLASSGKYLPGATMNMTGIAASKERADIIAALKTGH